jgi:hypothetical protein
MDGTKEVGVNREDMRHVREMVSKKFTGFYMGVHVLQIWRKQFRWVLKNSGATASTTFCFHGSSCKMGADDWPNTYVGSFSAVTDYSAEI